MTAAELDIARSKRYFTAFMMALRLKSFCILHPLRASYWPIIHFQHSRHNHLLYAQVYNWGAMMFQQSKRVHQDDAIKIATILGEITARWETIVAAQARNVSSC